MIIATLEEVDCLQLFLHSLLLLIGRIEELVKYCEEIASAAPELPFYYYHIPAFNGAYLPMLDLLKAVTEKYILPFSSKQCFSMKSRVLFAASSHIGFFSTLLYA